MDLKIKNINSSNTINDKTARINNHAKTQADYSNFTIAVIDDFDSVNPENLNLPHGKLVQKYITENLPGANIEPKRVLLNSENTEKMIFEQLQNIRNEIEQGKKYDAINMSVQTHDFIWIDLLKINSNGKKIQITNENINQYRKELKESYKKTFTAFTKTIETLGSKRNEKEVTKEINEHIEDLEKISEEIKKISEKNVKIFIANNNSCGTHICYSDLIDLDSDYENCNNPNIITVSANDCEERTTPLSDIKEQSIYKLNFLEKGIDITGNGIIDVFYDKNNIKKYIKENNITKIEGNSLATPAALTKYIKEKSNFDKK